jgi:hypothetical protein
MRDGIEAGIMKLQLQIAQLATTSQPSTGLQHARMFLSYEQLQPAQACKTGERFMLKVL